ncbi:MAG TPA: archaeosortase/exosortase family protein [Myxococcota bacterium]|nr:archaeosortase/exosortase family protein [Myxococcota bacterium]
MNAPPPPDPAPSARRLATLGLALALGAIAYRPLLASALQRPTAHEFETWLFRPSQLPAVLVLGSAGWMIWRRRARIAALPARRHRIATALLGGAGAALYVWALLTRSVDLLLPSLAANGLAFAAAARGRAGARALLLPALVVALGIPIPAPLRNEIVWGLQRATATAAAGALGWIGRDVVREGVILRVGEHSFHVIDGCSGLQGIATLTLVALAVGELLALPGPRRALLAALAPALGYALNVVRIAYIAASSDPERYAGISGDHTPQGLALLAAGTAALYFAGRALHGAGEGPPASPRPSAPGAVSPVAVAWLGLLAVLSFALPPFRSRSEPVAPPPLALPEQRAGWTSAPLAVDPYFLGTPLPGQMLQLHYVFADDEGANVVEILIARETARGGVDTSHLLSSKLDWPGPEWDLESRQPARLWDLARDATLSIASRPTGPERAVTYTWRLRDAGLPRESLRSLLALDASPLARERPRAVVRLVSYAPFDQPLALARAKRRLDRFIASFRAELSAL